MNKKLCFIIDGNRLFLEKVLVSFNGFPIYFLCVDKKDKYFIALCSDMDKMEYMIVEQPIYNIWKMVTGRICMRDLMTDCDFFWEVITQGEISEDIVKKVERKGMDLSVLPDSGAKYRIAEDDRAYFDEFTSKVLEKLLFDDIDTLAIETENSTICVQYDSVDEKQYTNLGVSKVDLNIEKEIKNEHFPNAKIEYIVSNETYNEKKRIDTKENNYKIYPFNYAA